MEELRTMKKGEKAIFALGDFFGGGAQALIGVLYLVFLVDIIGISPALAGTVVLISKLWDAITDPLMGVISDNTRTTIGRRRPYILIGGILVIVAFALMFYPINIQSEIGKTIFVLATYLFYNTVSTIISVPYSSLSAEISVIEKERNSTNVLRLVVSTTSSAICTLLPTFALDMLTKGQISINVFYVIIGIGFGVFFAIPLILIGIYTKERAAIPVERSKVNVKNFVRPLGVKVYRQLLGMYLCQSISMDILSAGIVLYAKYSVPGCSSTVLLGIFIGVQLLMFPFINNLVNKVDKNKIYYVGLPISIVAMIGLGLISKTETVSYIFTFFVALGYAGAQLISWIIFPQVVDVGELKMKERMTGSFSSIMTFIRKTSSAIAIFLFSFTLELVGYVNPPYGVGIVEQPIAAVWGIRIAMTVGFVLCMSIGFFIARKFSLSRSRTVQVDKFLKLLRENKLDAMSKKDKEEYKKLTEAIF